MESVSRSAQTDDTEFTGNAPALVHPRYWGLRSAVDRLACAGVPLSPPLEIRDWDGDARHGYFVQIDAATCALHVGRGCYITLDIQRDLNGVTPVETTRCMLCRSGAVRRPDSSRSYCPY